MHCAGRPSHPASRTDARIPRRRVRPRLSLNHPKADLALATTVLYVFCFAPLASCRWFAPAGHDAEAAKVTEYATGGWKSEFDIPAEQDSNPSWNDGTGIDGPQGIDGTTADSNELASDESMQIQENRPVFAPADPTQVGRDFAAVYFSFDSIELDFEARRVLRDYANWFIENPGIWVTLEGHCDRFGSREYNYNLGMARARAVRDRLAGFGVEHSRLFMISYGEERSIVEGDSRDALASNRRVEFRAYRAPDDRQINAAPSLSADAPTLRRVEDSPDSIEIP